MSPLVVGESTTGKDGSLMSLVPHRMRDLKPLEDCKCCISQHLQVEAEKLIGKHGFGIFPGETAQKKSRLSRKQSHNQLNPQKAPKITSKQK